MEIDNYILPLSRDFIKDYLPHRDPMLFIDNAIHATTHFILENNIKDATHFISSSFDLLWNGFSYNNKV